MSALISVIIPIYNVEKYLDRCIKSVVGQTHKNLEIILVDDGSPDNCPTMCDEWAKKDSRIKVIHKENGGQASARNKALDICNGDYISFIDSDDRILPNMYENMLTAMLENNADISVCGNLVDNGLRVAKICVTDKIKAFNTQEAIEEYFLKESIAPTVTNKLFAAAIFENIRFEEVRAKEDIMIVHELLHRAQKTILVPDAYYVITVRGDSTEGAWFSEKQLLSLEAAKKRRAFITEYYPHLNNEPKVRFDYISELKNKCHQINISFGLKKHKLVYEKLISEIAKEYQRLCAQSIEGTEGPLAEYKRVLDQPFLFRTSGVWEGCRRRVKMFIRRAVKNLRQMRVTQ